MIPLWLIQFALQARAWAASALAVLAKPLATTLPLGAWIALPVVALVATCSHGSAELKRGVTLGRAQVQATIDAPVTGWAAMLKQCRLDKQTLLDGIDVQNKAMKARSDQATASLTAQGAALKSAQATVARQAANTAKLMTPLAAGDTCTRVLEVDRRFLETLQ